MRMRERAFSLVEVTLALGVAAFCLIAIFGLLPVGLNANRSSIQQSVAANVATMIVSDLRTTPSGTISSPVYEIAIPQSGTTSSTIFLTQSGAKTTDMNAADYRTTVTIVPPAAGSRAATMARIRITSPAGATNVTPSFETVIGFDRN